MALHRRANGRDAGLTRADLTRELLNQGHAAGIKVRYLVLDRGFYSVEVVRSLQAARTPFLRLVVGQGRPADHPLGPRGSTVSMLLWLFEVAAEMCGLATTALTERPLPISVTT